MAKLFLKYRCTHFNQWQWGYSLSYLYNQDRSWYVENAWVNIQDCLINDYKNSSRWRKFWLVEFDDTKISKEDLEYDLNRYTQNAVVILTKEQAIQFIKDNTNLTELESWIFEIGSQVTLNLN